MPVTCPRCQGSTEVQCMKCNGNGWMDHPNGYGEAVCDRCDGDLRIACPKCNGLGEVEQATGTLPAS